MLIATLGASRRACLREILAKRKNQNELAATPSTVRAVNALTTAATDFCAVHKIHLIHPSGERISRAVLHCSKSYGDHARWDRLLPGHQGITCMTSKPKTVEVAAALVDQTAATAGKGFVSTVSGLGEGMARAPAGFADTQAKVKDSMDKVMKTAEEL